MKGSRVKIIFIKMCFFVMIISAVVGEGIIAFAGQDEDVSSLKDEIRQLKEEIKEQSKMYQEKLQAMEKRVGILETEKSGKDELYKFATEARIAAEESEKMALEAMEEAESSADSTEMIYVSDQSPMQQLPYVTKNFEFSGYLRSGFGVNGQGGQQVFFRAPGSVAKYRLGNETETYGELTFINHFNPEPEKAHFNLQVRTALWTPEDKNDSWTTDEVKFGVRESFVQADNFPWAPEMSFWAGQRFYRRRDIHINDFYIFDMSAYGGGVEDINIPIGDTKMAVAYLGGSRDEYEFKDIGKIAKNTLDIRFYDFNVPLGKGTIWLAPSAVKGGKYTTADDDGDEMSGRYDSTAGLALGFIHDHDFANDGYNEITFQYGKGTGSDFSPNVQDPSPTLDDAWRFRFTESNVINPCDHFCMMSDVIYQLDDSGASGDSQMTWISAGMRPVVCFTDHLALAFEAGLDYVDNKPANYDGILYKFTIAPEIRISNKFMGRPVLRVYFTYATWSNGFKGMVGNPVYTDDTAGISAGVQAEAWW